MSQSRMYVPRKSRFREHRPPRLLQNEIREEASIPVRQVRKDVLFDQRHAVLPSPASKGDFRHGRRSQSRRCQHFRDCSVEGIAWNTVARWLEKAAAACRRFNSRRIAGYVVEELQTDEIRSFAGGNRQPTWIFVAIEVWSRLWPSTVVGRRSYRNTLALLRDVANRMDWERLPLIVTDGFDFYEKSVTESVASLVQRLCTARFSRRAGMIVS